MDLWIRSQDKKRLVHAYGCEVVEALDGWKIREYATNDYVGKYKTKKRAIEVLNEIQNKLCLSLGYSEYPLRIIKRPDNTMDVQQLKADVLVYEMPQDEEVEV